MKKIFDTKSAHEGTDKVHVKVTLENGDVVMDDDCYAAVMLTQPVEAVTGADLRRLVLGKPKSSLLLMALAPDILQELADDNGFADELEKVRKHLEEQGVTFGNV